MGGVFTKIEMIAIPVSSGYLAIDAGADVLTATTCVAGGYLLTCFMYQYAKFMAGPQQTA